METTTPQQRADEIKQKFERFIKRVEGLQTHFTNHNRKACQLFSFSYAFETQLETNKPLFTLYFSYNGGYVESATFTEDERDEFTYYVQALHDVAYSMYKF